MYGPDAAILLMYGSHDMRHTGFRRLTVVNGTPGFWASQKKYKDRKHVSCRHNVLIVSHGITGPN